MKANIYKALSNKSELITIREGRTLAEEFDGFDLDNAVFIANGHEVGPDYKTREGDIITARLLPSGMTTLAVVSIFLGVTAIIGATAVGVALYQQKKAAEAEVEKMKKLANRPDIDNRPFLRGASNTIAVGNSQPFVIGHNFFTPYLHASPFYKLAGEDGADQLVFRIFEAGFNKQNIKKISLGDILIKDFTEDTPQQGPFTLNEGQAFAEGVGEITQDGSLLQTLPELNYKHETRQLNAEIPHDSEVENKSKIYFTSILNSNAKDVELAVSFPQGLYEYNDNNDKIETSITLTPQYSLDGGNTWYDFKFNINGILTNTIKKNAQKELRYIAHKVFTLADYQLLLQNKQRSIIVRVKNDSPRDNRHVNAVYCLYTQSLLFDPNKSSIPAGVLDDKGAAGLVNCLCVEDRERRYCTIIGLKIKATKANEAINDKMNIITNGLARVWTGSAWSTDKRPTSNPAAWLLEVLTSDTHPASRYSDDELDLEALGELYTHCEARGYFYDQIITQNTKKRDTLANICKCCDAALYRDIYGRLSVAIDRPQDNAVALFNSQNIVSLSNSRDFIRKSDGVRIKYVVSDGDQYVEDTYLLMREGHELGPDSIIKDIQLTGVTHFEHVVKYARRMMAIEILRPKTTTIEVGNEGLVLTPYAKVLIQDDSLKIGLANGIIKSVVYKADRLEKIITEAPLTFEEGKEYGLIINAFDDTDMRPLSIKVRGTGTTNELTVISPIYSTDSLRPEAGLVFSFGELDEGEFVRVATPYIINGIKRHGTRFALELVNYDPAIYDSGKIPAYKPNITEKPAPAPALPQFVEPLPGKPGEQGLTILIEKPAILYYSDPEGVVDKRLETCKISLFQGIKEIPILIDEIASPAGFEVYSVGSKVYIQALAGSAMAKQGIINVPIIYRPIVEEYSYSDEAQQEYIDEAGNKYGAIVYSKERYIYNVAISYAKSVKGQQGEKGERGADGADGPQGSRGARYWGTEKPADPVPFDFYLNKDTCLLEQYDGEKWAIVPESDPLYLQAIEDIIDNVDPNNPAQKDILAKANVYALKLTSKTILASQIFTQELVLKAPTDVSGQPTGKKAYIKSDNYKPNKSGFYLDSTGYLEASNAKIRGEIEATSGSFKGEVTASQIYFTVNKGNIRLGRLLWQDNYNHFEKQRTLIRTEFESIATGTISAKLAIMSNNPVIPGGREFFVVCTHVSTDDAGNPTYTDLYRRNINVTVRDIDVELWKGDLKQKVGDYFELYCEQVKPDHDPNVSYLYHISLYIDTDRKNPALAAMSKFIDVTTVYN